jgi:hypothetical protein
MVALSTTESEYIGLSIASQHLAWLCTFLPEFGHPQQLPTGLGNDNMAAIILSKNPQFRARAKHIQRKYHFVRDDLIAKERPLSATSPLMTWLPPFSARLYLSIGNLSLLWGSGYARVGVSKYAALCGPSTQAQSPAVSGRHWAYEATEPELMTASGWSQGMPG